MRHGDDKPANNVVEMDAPVVTKQEDVDKLEPVVGVKKGGAGPLSDWLYKVMLGMVSYVDARLSVFPRRREQFVADVYKTVSVKSVDGAMWMLANVMGYKYVPYSYDVGPVVDALNRLPRYSVGGKRHGVTTTSSLEFSNAAATIDGVTAVASVASTWRTNGPAFSGRTVLNMARVLGKEANAGLLNMGSEVLLRAMLGCKHMAVSEGLFPGNTAVGVDQYEPHATISAAWEHWPGKAAGIATTCAVINVSDYASIVAGDDEMDGFPVDEFGALGDDGIAIVPIHTSDLSSSLLINWALCHMAWPRRMRAGDAPLRDIGSGAARGTVSSMEVSSLALIDGPTSKVLFVVVDMLAGQPDMQFGNTAIVGGATVDITTDLDSAPVGMSQYPESWLTCVRKWYDYVGNRDLAASAFTVAADLSMLVDQPNVNTSMPHYAVTAVKSSDPSLPLLARLTSDSFSSDLRSPCGVGTNLVTTFPIGNGPFRYYTSHRVPWSDHTAYVASAAGMVKPVDVVDCPYYDAYEVDAKTYRAARAMAVYFDSVVRMTGVSGQMLYPGDVRDQVIYGTLDMGIAMSMQRGVSKFVQEGVGLLVPGNVSDFMYGGKNAFDVTLMSPAFDGAFETPCTRLSDWVIDSICDFGLHVTKPVAKLDMDINSGIITMALADNTGAVEAVVGKTNLVSTSYSLENMLSVLQLQTFWVPIGYHADMSQVGRWVPRQGDGLSKWAGCLVVGDIWERALGLPTPIVRDMTDTGYVLWNSWGVPRVATFVGRRPARIVWNGLVGVRNGVAVPTVLVKHVGSDLFSNDYSSAVDDFRGFDGI